MEPTCLENPKKPILLLVKPFDDAFGDLDDVALMELGGGCPWRSCRIGWVPWMVEPFLLMVMIDGAPSKSSYVCYGVLNGGLLNIEHGYLLLDDGAFALGLDLWRSPFLY
jgi:hypothetical protein